jgi:glutamine cyclotransferase
MDKNDEADVLNGIAYDAAGDRMFITGKKWRRLFEIKVTPR